MADTNQIGANTGDKREAPAAAPADAPPEKKRKRRRRKKWGNVGDDAEAPTAGGGDYQILKPTRSVNHTAYTHDELSQTHPPTHTYAHTYKPERI